MQFGRIIHGLPLEEIIEEEILEEAPGATESISQSTAEQPVENQGDSKAEIEAIRHDFQQP